MAGIDILSDEDEVLCPAPASKDSPASKQKEDELVALWSESDEEMVTTEAAKANPPKEAPTPTPAPAVVADLSDDEDEMLCPAKAPPAKPRPPATPQAALNAAPAAPAGDAAEVKLEKPSEKPAEKPKKGKAKEKAKPQPKAAEKPPAAAEKAPAAPVAAPAPAVPAAPTVAEPEKEAAKVAAQPKVAAKAKTEAKGSKEVKKLSKDEMEAKVLEYMRQQNRPYNSQNVFDNLHGAVPKASVQAIMESLVAEGKLLLKEYGKIKVFLVSQTSMASEDAGQLQQQVDEVSKKRKELHGSLDTLRKEMSQVAAKHSAAKEAKESQTEAARLEEQAEKWRATADGDRVDESEVRAVETEFAQVHQAWRKRKRLCMDTLGALGEGMGVRTSQLVETYGVDTDEDCNQLMPQEFMQ